MSGANNSHPRPTLQSAVDARTDADRAALERELKGSNGSDRSEALGLLADVAAYREALQSGELPVDLESRLLAIPEQIPRRFDWREWMQQPIGWAHWAACAALALVVSVAGYFYATYEPKPPHIAMLDATVAAHVRDLAMQSESAKPSQDNTDPAKAFALLPREGLAFTPQLIRPAASMQFIGAGIASFGGKSAVFTQWTAGSSHYTLYQFDGACLGLPAVFIDTSVPANQPNTQITVWPGMGGACGWALVAVDAPPGNPFRNSY